MKYLIIIGYSIAIITAIVLIMGVLSKSVFAWLVLGLSSAFITVVESA